jgi:hypothetical protein
MFLTLEGAVVALTLVGFTSVVLAAQTLAGLLARQAR